MKFSGERFLGVIGTRHAAVAVLAAITGLYYLIVAFTNCIDTTTNRRGVAAVLSMRATIHNPGTSWRAITNGNFALVVYILIVIWEFLTAFALLAGAAVWLRALTARARRSTLVQRASALSSLGWTMGIMLFLGGFLTVAGEWFRMWANKEVNASSAALQNFLIAAVGLILVHLGPAAAESPADRSQGGTPGSEQPLAASAPSETAPE